MRRPALLLALFIGLGTLPCRAQSTSDLIQQLLLDVRKLEDLKFILTDMKKGYEIMDKGYTAIRDIARGHYELDKAFLDGLLAVSPTVRTYYRVAAIMDAASTLAKEYRLAQGQAGASGLFTSPELSYFEEMYSTLYKHSVQSLDDLRMVITDGMLRMPDAQRLRSIDRVYAAINGQLRAVRQLGQEVSLQAQQRQHAKNELNLLKLLYGNP